MNLHPFLLLFFISLFILVFKGGFSAEFFTLSKMDWFYLFILASVCTAYAFIASIYILKFLSPYTLVLTYNLEPVYGILLAIFIFPDTEKMEFSFYIGTLIIISTIIINSILKIKNNKRNEIRFNKLNKKKIRLLLLKKRIGSFTDRP